MKNRFTRWLWVFTALFAVVASVAVVGWSLLKAREALQKSTETVVSPQAPVELFDRTGFEELKPRLERRSP